MSFLRHRIVLGLRHRDGGRLTEPEIQSVLDQSGNSPFSQPWASYWQQHEKEFKTQLLPRLIQMTGIYNAPFGLFANQNPRFAFDLHLPGQIVETSGTLEGQITCAGGSQATYRFPMGTSCKRAASRLINRAKRKSSAAWPSTTASRPSLTSGSSNSDGRLLKVMRKAHASGDLEPLFNDRPVSTEDQERLKRLKVILRLDNPVP